jgi:ribose 1,5-bisphosphokinase
MPDGRIGPGGLVAVVGPSGAGKDSIIRAARAQLAADPRIAFPRRVITRAPDPHEDHVSVERAAFRQLQSAGAFALCWEAHGLCYGIPAAVDGMLAEAKTVVLNLSRAVVPHLRTRYANVVVVAISVDREILAQRLAARGRESPEEIAQRIARRGRDEPVGAGVIEIRNDGELQDAVHRFVTIVLQAADSTARNSG